MSILNDVERACTQLRRDGQPVTFTAVAAAIGIARSTLYRNTAIRAAINEQRHHAAANGTRRLHGSLGMISLVEFEQHHYATLNREPQQPV